MAKSIEDSLGAAEAGTAGLDTATEDTPLSGSSGRDLEETDGDSRKRKEHPKATGNRFKVVAQMVTAMQRWQASINPTYTYGKRPSDQGGSTLSGTSAGSVRDEVTSSAPGIRNQTPPPAPKVYANRGNRAKILFAPLPDPEPKSVLV